MPESICEATYYSSCPSTPFDRRPRSLKRILHPELDGSGPMRVHRMQKRTAGKTVGASYGPIDGRTLKTSTIVGPTIAADFVTTGVAQIRIVKPELRMIEEIECLCAGFHNEGPKLLVLFLSSGIGPGFRFISG